MSFAYTKTKLAEIIVSEGYEGMKFKFDYNGYGIQ